MHAVTLNSVTTEVCMASARNLQTYTGTSSPSRHGTYDGISMHPFETVFLKASWHVGEPHLSHYTRCAAPAQIQYCYLGLLLVALLYSRKQHRRPHFLHYIPEMKYLIIAQTCQAYIVPLVVCIIYVLIALVPSDVNTKRLLSRAALGLNRGCMVCRWFLSHADGDPHTSGSFHESQYRYAILPEAQDPNNASACFTLPAWELS